MLIQMDFGGSARRTIRDQQASRRNLTPRAALLAAPPLRRGIATGFSEIVPSGLRSRGWSVSKAGSAQVPNEAAAIQQNVVKGVIIPFLASIEDDGERSTQTTAAEKAFGKSLEGWISSARRRVS